MDPSAAVFRLLLMCAAGSMGCAAQVAPKTAFGAKADSLEAPSAYTNPGELLSPAERAAYEERRVELRDTAASSYVLRRGDQNITETEFRKQYRELSRSDELDDNVRALAKAQNRKTVAIAAAMATGGVGSLTAISIFQPTICHKEPSGSFDAQCGKAAIGIASLALIGLAGLAVLGCEVFKGADCLLDDGRQMLSRSAAAYFVTKYNTALLASLRGSSTNPPAASETRSSDDDAGEAASTSRHVSISPFGIVANF